MRRMLTSWRAWVFPLLVAAATSSVAGQAPTLAKDDPGPPALSALQQCQVEHVALQAQVVELRAKLVELQTALDRQALAAERTRLEGTLPIQPGWRWDWAQLRMVAKETEPR